MFNNIFKSKKSAGEIAKTAAMLYLGYRVAKRTGVLDSEIGRAVSQPVKEEAAIALARGIYKAVF